MFCLKSILKGAKVGFQDNFLLMNGEGHGCPEINVVDDGPQTVI